MSYKFTLSCLVSILLITNPAFAQSDNYEEALKSFSKRDFASAHIHIKNSLKENANNLSAKLLLAKILIEKHAYKVAEDELTNTLLQGADINLIVEPLGKSLLLQAKFEEALTFTDDTMLTKQGKLAFNLVKAKAYHGLLNTESSEEIYRQVLHENPNNLTALLGLASLYLSINNIDEIDPLLERAKVLDEKNSQLWRLKGLLARQANKLQQALAFFKKANELEPNNLVTYRGLANSYFDLKDAQQANLFLDKILAISPKDPQAQLMKSSLHYSLNEKSVADKILAELTNQLSSINETYLESQPQLLLIDSLASYRQGNWQQARQKFQTYLARSPNDIDATILLADVYIKLNETHNALALLEKNETRLLKNKDHALILVGLYFQDNKLFKADYLLSELRSMYINDESVLIASAKVFSEIGQISKALTLLEDKLGSNSAVFHHTLALLYFQTGQLQKSQIHIKLAIVASPESIDFQLLHSQLFIQFGEFEQAQQLITELYHKHPENNEVLSNYALIQASIGKTEAAQKIYKQLVALESKNGAYWLQLASFENDLGNNEEAIIILENQSRHAEFKKEALNKLALLYFQARQFEKSLETVNRSLKDNRLDTQAIALKFRNLIALNDNEAAKHQINILRGLEENDAVTLLKISRMFQQIGNFQSADKNLSKARVFAPNNMTILIDSIKLKLRLHQTAEARKLLNKAKQVSYNNDIRLFILSGDLAVAKNNKKQAFNFYQQALKQDNSNIIALVKLAQVSATKTLSDQFITYLSALVDKYPQRNFQQHTLADYLLVYKKYTLAKFQYQQLLTKAIPNNKKAVILNNLANIEIIEEDFVSAVQSAEQALKLVKAQAPLLDTLGWALTLLGEPNKGLKYLREAFTMSSSSPDIQYHMAYTLVQLNRVDEALPLLRQVVNMPNNFPEHSLAKGLLAKLK